MANSLDVVVKFVGDATGAVKAANDTESAYTKMGDKLRSVGKTLSLSLSLPLAAAGVAAIKELESAGKVAAQTNAVLRSTGGVANVTAKEVDQLAESLMKKSGIDDEAIKSSENLLLTFTNIRDEAGKGNDIFKQATKVSLDLSVALGKDLASSTTIVAKALNDPVKGLGALGKAGVQFTEDQKALIKSLAESGDIMGAQKIILKELETQVGGSAAAYGQTMAGQVSRAKEALLNASASIVAVAAPALELFAQGALKVANFLSGLPPALQAVVGGVGIFLAVLGPTLSLIGNLVKIAGPIKSAFETIYLAALYAGEGLVAFAVPIAATVAAVGVFVAAAYVLGSAFREVTGIGQDGFEGLLSAVERGKKAGEGWADTIIAGAKASADPIQELRLRLDTLRTSQDSIKSAVDSGRMSTEEGAQAWVRHKTAIDTVKTALAEAKQAGEEQAAAAAAQRVANDQLAASHQGVANATNAQITAVSSLNNAMLAAQGGILGYQAAQLNVEQAQKRFDDLVAGGSVPTSFEYRQALNQLQQAQLQAAGAAFTMEGNQGTLSNMLKTGGVGALISYRDSLVNAIRTTGDATGATQQQIDKVNALILTANAAEVDKTAHFHAETREANETIAHFNERADAAVRDRTARVAVVVSNAVGPGGEMLGFAAGGVVPGPRGAPQLAVVHGGETIIPVGVGPQVGTTTTGSGLANTYNLTVNVAPGVSSAEVGAVVVDQIRAYERAAGRAWRTG